MRGPDEQRAQRARSLRKSLTRTEFILWSRIRNRQLDGFKFVRQQPIGPYCADFVCRERSLVVEVDGGQHANSVTDRRRDEYLAGRGYRVVRVWNNQVAENIDGVLQMLLSELRQ